MTSLKSVSQEFDSVCYSDCTSETAGSSHSKISWFPGRLPAMVQPYPFPFRVVPSLTCITEVLRPPPMFSQQPFPFCTIPHAIRLKFTVRQIARNKRFLCSLPRLLESRFNGELTAPRFWEEASSLPRDAVTGREKYTYYWIKWKTTEWWIEWWTCIKWKTVL